jgi:hypothetical protein
MPGWAERYVKTLSQPQHSNNKLLNKNNGIKNTAAEPNNYVSGKRCTENNDNKR